MVGFPGIDGSQFDQVQEFRANQQTVKTDLTPGSGQVSPLETGSTVHTPTKDGVDVINLKSKDDLFVVNTQTTFPDKVDNVTANVPFVTPVNNAAILNSVSQMAGGGSTGTSNEDIAKLGQLVASKGEEMAIMIMRHAQELLQNAIGPEREAPDLVKTYVETKQAGQDMLSATTNALSIIKNFQ